MQPIRKDDASPIAHDAFYAPAHQPLSHQQIVRRIQHLNADISFWQDAPKLASYSRRFDAGKIEQAEAEIARLDGMLEIAL